MTCTVVIHEGVVPDELHGPLVDGLRTIYAAAVPTSDSEPRIITVPRGRWYTAGEQSHSSIVATTVPTGTDTQARIKLLKQICDFWCGTTGCTPEAIVVTASDERDCTMPVYRCTVPTGALDDDARKRIAADVTVSTEDIPASWVMEGGELLPEPGDEAAWFARLGRQAGHRDPTPSAVTID